MPDGRLPAYGGLTGQLTTNTGSVDKCEFNNNNNNNNNL